MDIHDQKSQTLATSAAVLPRLLLPALICLTTSLAIVTAPAAVGPDELALDASLVEPFSYQLLKYESTEKSGPLPGPWVPGGWADNAVTRYELVADGGDGAPAIKMWTVSGQPSLMFKPWTTVGLDRGSWTLRMRYRKTGSASGALATTGPGEDKRSVPLPPTGAAYQQVELPLEITQPSELRIAIQLYAGVGEGEAIYLRSLSLAKSGDVSAATKAAEREANQERDAFARQVAEREAARRAAERQPIGDWVRPEWAPVAMTEPLTPPPVTGETYYVATTGDNTAGDGSEASPWRTIQHGMDQLHPGDRLYIRGGEYRESMLTFKRSGRHDAYITVAGYPSEVVKVVNSGGLAVFNLSAGSRWTPVMLDELAYIVIRDLHIDAVDGNNAIRVHGPMMLDEYKGKVAESRGLRHNIWIVGNDITGGNGYESLLGGGYGAHDLIISNNHIHDTIGGINNFTYNDTSIIEWNTITNCCADGDDGGAIKSMAPAVIIRYNTVIDNRRSPTSTKPGWAPASQGGKQWRFLQGVTGIYLDWAMLSIQNNDYPDALKPADPSNYVYGNTVTGSDAGIYVYLSDFAKVFDNLVYENGTDNSGGWVEGKQDGKWLEFVGPAGNGIIVTKSEGVRVYGNISHGNRKAGLASNEAPGLQAFSNVVYGNRLAQVHIVKKDVSAYGFNTIIDAGTQGPPFRWYEQDFSSIDAFRKAHPYVDEGTGIVPLAAGGDALAQAKAIVAQGVVPEQRWLAAVKRLTDAAHTAGIGKPAEVVPQATFDPHGGLQEPLPWALPGTIECENYDVGGQEVSYYDFDRENQGGHYRNDAVDIKSSATGSNGAVVGFTRNGEWMEYICSLQRAGRYPMTLTYATPMENRGITVSVVGGSARQTVTVAPTANWEDLQQVAIPAIDLPAGDVVLRILVESGPIDLDRLVIEPAR